MLDFILDIIFAITDYHSIYDGDRQKAKTGYLYRGLVLVSLIPAVIFFAMESTAANMFAIAFCGVGVFFAVKSRKFDMKCLRERREAQEKRKAEEA